MRSAREFGLAWAVLVCAAACASGGGSSAAESDLTVPRMMSRAAPPQLRIPPSLPSGRPSMRVDIEVLIDENGQPDMSTFKLTGFGAEENREALRNWIEQANYRPAYRGGEAIPGLYRTHLEVRVERRRIS
jgi:hypothetical protein